MADEKDEVDDVCEAVDRQERFSARPRVPDDPGNGFFILAQPENLDFSSSIPLPTHSPFCATLFTTLWKGLSSLR